MSNPYKFSRRRLLQGAGALAGASALSGVIPGVGSLAHAQTAATKSAVLVIFLNGGYNALFGSADSFQPAGTFGVTAGNMRALSNGLVVDGPTFGTLPAPALANMASIGLRHGSSDHGNARNLNFTVAGQNAALRLAAEMGGSAALKAAVVGAQMTPGPGAAVNGVSLQAITDTRTTIAALGGAPDPSVPERDVAAAAIGRSSEMSAGLMASNTRSLRTVGEGYAASIDTLRKPVPVFNFAEMSAAYNVPTTTTAVTTFPQRMLAAELMIRAGANVVMTVNGGWDTHGDRTGTTVRNKMNADILPGLRTFLARAFDPAIMGGYNITTVITGDFARSLPGSDHASGTTVTVIGPNVMQGTTGRMSANVALAPTTPSTAGLWAYLAAVSKVGTQPFGVNPHNLVKVGAA